MNREGFDKLGLLVGVLIAATLLFAPLIIVWFYEVTQSPDDVPGAAEVTVGVAVIVRAAARRVLTTAVSSILRTAFATFSRTVARTVLRRLMRFWVRALFGVLAREAARSLSGNRPVQVSPGADRRRPYVPLTIGTVALALSFYGVVLVTDAEQAVTQDGHITLLTASVLAGLPLLVYGAIHLWAARRVGVLLRFNTAFDGLLLQAYFTGAGSFLPMTTDVEYRGSRRGKMWLATICLASMYVIHLVLWVLASISHDPILSFASGTFLIFCFVYIFPIQPLEGNDIWAGNKWLWVGVWIPILLSFFASLPESLASIL